MNTLIAIKKKLFTRLIIFTTISTFCILLISSSLKKEKKEPINKRVQIQLLKMNRSLTELNFLCDQENEEFIKLLKKTIRFHGNNTHDLEQLRTAKEIRIKTKKTLSYIDSLKTKIIQLSGGFYYDGITPNGIFNTEVAKKLFFEKSEETNEGKKLIQSLDEYIVFLNDLIYDFNQYLKKTPSKNHFPKLTYDGHMDPKYIKYSELKKKSFLELAFQESTVMESYAFLTEIQSNILSFEKQTFNTLLTTIKAPMIHFDELIPTIIPESKIVNEGEKFKAQMFITSGTSINEDIKQSMKFCGKDINIINGVGSINIPANVPDGSKLNDEGLYEYECSAEIYIESISGYQVPLKKDFIYYINPKK